MVNNGELALVNSGAQSYGGVISGTGSVLVTGGGALTLSNANTYGGATLIAGATLVLGVDNALPAGSQVQLGDVALGGGTLELNGHNQTIAGLTSGATSIDHDAASDLVTNSGQAATLTVDNASDGLYGGRLEGNLTLAKYGAGTLTLSGSGNAAGGIAVYDGTLHTTTCFWTPIHAVPGSGDPHVVKDVPDPHYYSVDISTHHTPSSVFQLTEDKMAGTLAEQDGSDWLDAVARAIEGKSVRVLDTGETYTFSGTGSAGAKTYPRPDGYKNVIKCGAYVIGTVRDLEAYMLHLRGDDIFEFDGTDHDAWVTYPMNGQPLPLDTKVIAIEDEYGMSFSDEDYDDWYWIVGVASGGLSIDSNNSNLTGDATLHRRDGTDQDKDETAENSSDGMKIAVQKTNAAG
ncbi:MAG: autotransporter-associated beta strand repeat-containing protein, partial [Planctomycetota bacterium]